MEKCGIRTAISSDDGTVGYQGFVTSLLEKWISDRSDITLYGCGPEPMMKAIVDISSAANLKSFLSTERNMACGMGTCQSCTVKIADNSPSGWSHKLCCGDGPVFEGSKIYWE